MKTAWMLCVVLFLCASVMADEPVKPVCFSVDGGEAAAGRPNPNPAEGLNPAQASPDDVFSLGAAGGFGLPTEAEIFQAPVAPANGNYLRISGALGLPVGPIAPPSAVLPAKSLPPALGLIRGDNVDALSFGKDGGNVLHFSVGPNSMGMSGTDVNYQAVVSPPATIAFPLPYNTGGGAPGHEAAGDIFISSVLAPFGAYSTPDTMVPGPAVGAPHRLELDELRIGLQAPDTMGTVLGPPEDDLDALELADASDRKWGVDLDGDGLPDPGRSVFFSLDRYSPSLTAVAGAAPISPADILVTTGPVKSFSVYAPAATMGLLPDDDLDALVLSDVHTIGRLDPKEDTALFSLAPGSPSLSTSRFSPADVFFTDFTGTFILIVKGIDLGLLMQDDINALDITQAIVVQPTITPVKPTECPKGNTFCPIMNTACPAVNTSCPANPTLCAPVAGAATVCPDGNGVVTVCPWRDTQCPWVVTKCPAKPTLCANSVAAMTLCSDVRTACPEMLTACSFVSTICTDTTALTACPDGTATTSCPNQPTACGGSDTTCSQQPTVCAPMLGAVTACPNVPTFCPLRETYCPEKRTTCPAVYTLCMTSSTYTKCPDGSLFPTTCPVEVTVCQVAPTTCSALPTACNPGHETT